MEASWPTSGESSHHAITAASNGHGGTSLTRLVYQQIKQLLIKGVAAAHDNLSHMGGFIDGNNS